MRRLCIAALALSAFFAFHAPPAYAIKRLVSREVQWLNKNRVAGSGGGLTFQFAGGTRPDTVYTDLVGATDLDTTMAVTITDLTTPPFWTPKSARGVGFNAQGTSDTSVVDTVIVGRVTIYSDTVFNSTVTAVGLFTDVVVADTATFAQAPQFNAIVIDSTSYGTMGNQRSYSFPLFAYVNPRTGFVNKNYSNRVTNPTAVGGILGQEAIRFRFASPLGVFRKVRCRISYWAEI